MKTPVALIIFNRPETTQKVFHAIRDAKPPQLLVIADGPRVDRPEEAKRCNAARAIIEQVDWKCEVMQNYSEINLGCRARVASGLDWVFNTVEEAIILEDDCLPHPTFFQFCEELLDYYHDDQRIMAISGDSSRAGRRRTDYSYYFSKSTPIWGWATWRRAWQHYDVNLKLWPTIRSGSWLQDILHDDRRVGAWEENFEKIYAHKIDTWDYQWTFACWVQNGLTAIASSNLISNCGFSEEATHTKDVSNPLANVATKAMRFPLHHSPFVIQDAQAENAHFEMDHPDRVRRAIRKLRRMQHRLLSAKLLKV